MRLYGLIGFPLSHSFSGKYFADKFIKEDITDARYNLYPLENISMLPELIHKNEELLGLNVTIPYKEKVLPFLNHTDIIATAIGAANTIKILRRGEKIFLKGFNTDSYGFSESLKPLLTEENRKGKALILGTGGSSRAVEWVLRNMGFGVTFVSRTPRTQGHIAYGELTEHIIRESRLIVNTTPKGMFPYESECPDIPYSFLTPEHILYDLICNPDETLFMKKGRERGAVTKNGLQMLHLQAEKSWEIWNTYDL